jgi:glycosyltransferase involved in cell wall biosynthesis
MRTPLVSIIIPCYNREKIICDTLDSVLAQTYQNWECIIIDDGSFDNTLKVVELYCLKDNRLKLLKRDREPKGAQTCRNIGLANAYGEFLIFLDSDDILFPYALMERTAFLLERSELDFCIASGVRGKYPISDINKYYLISTFKSKNVLPEFFNCAIPWNVLNVVYRKNSLLKSKITWSENLRGFQDIDFHVKCVLADLNFDYCTHEPDCVWREHNHDNIGKTELGNDIKIFQQKLILLKNNSAHHNLKEEDILPLYVYFHRFYLYSNIDIISSKFFFEDLYKNPIKREFLKILFGIYRWAYNKKIKKIKGLFYTILIKLGQEKYMLNHVSEHFMTKQYFPIKK